MSTNDFSKIAAYGPDMAEYLEVLGYDSPSIAASAAPLKVEGAPAIYTEGNPQAKLMFIGEASQMEGFQPGSSFSGPSGELLAKMISAMGFALEDVCIANIAKYWAPEMRDPTLEEIQLCSSLLNKELEVRGAELLVSLGGFATHVVLGNELPLDQLRGKRWEQKVGARTLPVFPTFHPSFLIENPEYKKVAWEDLKQVMSFFNSHSY